MTPMPDTDFEACPVGAMDAMKKAESAIVRWIEDGELNPSTGDLEALKACRAILKAHRDSLEPAK